MDGTDRTGRRDGVVQDGCVQDGMGRYGTGQVAGILHQLISSCSTAMD